MRRSGSVLSSASCGKLAPAERMQIVTARIRCAILPFQSDL